MFNLNFCHFRICLNDCTCLHSRKCTSPHERPAGNFKHVFITGGNLLPALGIACFHLTRLFQETSKKQLLLQVLLSLNDFYNCICTYWTHIYKSDNMKQDVFATTLKQACLQVVTILFFF